MFEPAVTGLGVPALVIDRSHATPMVVTTVVVSVFTEFVADRVEVRVVVVAVTLGATLTTTTILAASPTANEGSVHVTVPATPTAGVVQVQPTGAITEAYVVFAGVASVKVAVVAAAGPSLVMVEV
jgi:hypothetical protein